MSTTAEIRQALPTGTWHLDPVHSSIGFAVDYMVGTFRGSFSPVQGTLEVAEDGTVELTGSTRATNVDGGDELTIRGEITIKGVTRPVGLTGRATEPLTDAYGRERFGLTVETKVDRTAFGLNWNLPLPNGEPALSNDVTLVAELFFVKEV